MSGEIDPVRAPDDEAHAGPEMTANPEASSEALMLAVLSVGQQLRAAREARGLAVADVAKAIKLGPRQVVAIEADDWPSLPCTTIIRGFVRNYARLLELNPDPLMSALDSLKMPQAPELEMSVGSPVNIPQEGKVDRREYVRVISGLVVLVLAVLAYFFLPQELLNSALSALKDATQSRGAAAEKVVAPGADAARSSDVAVAPPATSVLPEGATTPPLQSVPVSASAPASPNVLQFSFAQPSWVEVRDRSGQIIFSQLSQADSQRDIEGQPPFALVIGNASHVTLQYKGKTVDLSLRSKDDVARLTLE
ncbi:MAG: helix-turn-helix domain-containing protein [Propionivibrio sp.]|uniref:Helix-turn-helix domain-containing protein n=1 Tax=Candidatus Propionivibrio dominans TaxID=2954373 RepID=A0A9D7I5Z3_9RHOO|nr:helix-turn-helix domain-containing protein [Candidatus Propionivibrio dominans]MBL0168229.1 helix-turn-helix domain-containing protein [Propionivibrio sp.]